MERFEKHVSPEPTSGCWLWTAFTDAKGYGTIWFRNTTWKAHRLSWLIHHGEIPDKLFVLHRCDVPCCVNPAHLFLGTHQDNMDDMMKKGRWGGGKKGKFSDEEIKAVRTLYATGNMLQRDLVQRFNISKSSISRIVQNSGISKSKKARVCGDSPRAR